MLKARREGSGQVTRGGAAAQKLSPITCHSPHHHRIGASVHPPAPVLPARTHDMRGLKASAEGFLLFASLLFILLHQKKPSFAPGPLPPPPPRPLSKACCKCNTGDFNGSITAQGVETETRSLWGRSCLCREHAVRSLLLLLLLLLIIPTMIVRGYSHVRARRPPVLHVTPPPPPQAVVAACNLERE